MLVTGAGLGASLMFILDPRSGRRRRAVAQDRIFRAASDLPDAADTAVRDLANRVVGAICDGWATIGRRNETVVDEVLEPRVRAKLGRLVSHPSAIDVRVQNGRVILSGPVLENEADFLLQS